MCFQVHAAVQHVGCFQRLRCELLSLRGLDGRQLLQHVGEDLLQSLDLLAQLLDKQVRILCRGAATCLSHPTQFTHCH